MVALRARRKKARAGNVLSLTRDVSRPRATSYTVHVRFVHRFARMPTHGNLVYVAQWPGVNAHDAVDITMPLGTGTPHGQLAPSCI